MSLSPGTRLHEYEIVAHVRDGGMAALYLARKIGAAGFSRPVAIKVIHPQFAKDPSLRQMFIDEAKTSVYISHPNVVQTHDFGEVGGNFYLAMEFVHGTSLAQLLGALAKRGRRLSPEIATHIAMRMADGLHAAHEARADDGQPLGVVHRDVSPQNVLISMAGLVKIIDFGVAKARTREQQTTAASLKGKIRYMAPEQAFGRTVDRRTDVYAIGIVLWEMLTMRRLFHADDDFALLDLVRQPNVPPPSTYSSDVPPELDQVVLAALNPGMDGRIPTAFDLRNELGRSLPRAMSVDEKSLSDLLRAVEKDIPELDSSFARLGSNTGATPKPQTEADRQSAERAFEAFTRNDLRLDTDGALVAPAPDFSPPSTTFDPRVAPPPPANRKWLIAAAAVALIGAGGGWAAVAFKGDEGPTVIDTGSNAANPNNTTQATNEALDVEHPTIPPPVAPPIAPPIAVQITTDSGVGGPGVIPVNVPPATPASTARVEREDNHPDRSNPRRTGRRTNRRNDGRSGTPRRTGGGGGGGSTPISGWDLPLGN